MASTRNGTPYTGVTSDLARRGRARKPGFRDGTACKLLVFYEFHELITDAIAREKQIKAGSQAKKLALIEGMNPRLEGFI